MRPMNFQQGLLEWETNGNSTSSVHSFATNKELFRVNLSESQTSRVKRSAHIANIKLRLLHKSFLGTTNGNLIKEDRQSLRHLSLYRIQSAEIRVYFARCRNGTTYLGTRTQNRLLLLSVGLLQTCSRHVRKCAKWSVLTSSAKIVQLDSKSILHTVYSYYTKCGDVSPQAS